MPYVTLPRSPAYRQLRWEDLLDGEVPVRAVDLSKSESNTVTRFMETVPDSIRNAFDIPQMVFRLSGFCRQYADLIDTASEHYYTFRLHKKSGGFREIHAPDDELKHAQTELCYILEHICHASHHTSAFAYVKERSTVDAVRKHQQNNSHWFLHTDFSDFFGSTTKMFLVYMLRMIFPFSEILSDPVGNRALPHALDICFLDGGLPQGTTTSPMLTNLMMIPFDHMVSNGLRSFLCRRADGLSSSEMRFVYTRYADDIHISCQYDFRYSDVISFMTRVLHQLHAPFSFKPEKTHYGSRSGKNWILGVKLNKENEITVGYENKRELKAMIHSYVTDRKRGVSWPIGDLQHMHGILSYHLQIEPDYHNAMLKALSQRYGFDIKSAIEAEMKQPV